MKVNLMRKLWKQGVEVPATKVSILCLKYKINRLLKKVSKKLKL
jgi:hypothetical protein